MVVSAGVFAAASVIGPDPLAGPPLTFAAGTAPKLELRLITHGFASGQAKPVAALENITTSIGDNRFVSIIGPSGCGKSTLFNIIAGLIKPVAGSVHLEGRDISGMVGFVGYMLQKDLLLPWRTVLDNVILGMELQGARKPAARARAMRYLTRYGLDGFERRYPAALSGGMRQRAALLRTLLYDSEVILLDEPFGALDAQTRAQMQQWLLQIWEDFAKTVVFITHDVDEAVYLSDQIVVMGARPGRILSVIEVPLARPRSPSIAQDQVFLDIKRRCLALLQQDRGSDPTACRRREEIKLAPRTRNRDDQPAAPAERFSSAGQRRGRVLGVERLWPAWCVLATQVAIVVSILGLWEAAARESWIDAFFWSSPANVFATFKVFVSSGNAFFDTWFTFRATVSAFVLGTVFGAAIGLSFWWSRNYARVAQPFLICFESTPKLALAPLIVLVFGIGLASKVALGVALTVVVTTLTTFSAIRALDPDSPKLMYSLGASRWQVFSKLVVPSVLPWIISSLRINIGLALTGAVIGEFISSEHGLGRQILYASQVYDIALIWVAVGVLAGLSIGMYALVGQIERLLLRGLMHGSSY